MLKALNPLTGEWYIPRAERGKADAAEFLIRPLSGIERFEVELRRDENGNPALTERGGRAVLKYGLQGWKNISDKAGVVEFHAGDLEGNLSRLDLDITAELASEIWIRSSLTEEQRKNLLSPPMSPPMENNSIAQVAGGAGTVTIETAHQSNNGQSLD